MRYVNAYGASPKIRKLERIVTFLLLVWPLATLVILYYHNGGKSPLKLPGVKQLAALLAPVVIGFIYHSVIFRRQVAMSVDIDQDGVRHNAPGRARFIPWSEVTQVRRVHTSVGGKGKGRDTVQLVYHGGKYRFDPFLMPDDGSAKLKFSFAGLKWQLSDGTTEPADIFHSAAFKAVQQYRGDLMANIRK